MPSLQRQDQHFRDVDTYEAALLCQSASEIKACDGDACRLHGVRPRRHAPAGRRPDARGDVRRHADGALSRNPADAGGDGARDGRAGFAGILARLADVVSAFIVRGREECGCGDATGWVEALRDPRLGRVIAALHRDPGRNWTLGRSRSVFAERFLAVTGMTPVRYLTELRLASQWIGRDRMPIEIAAHRLGYGSQAAFSRAFNRVIGRSPGVMRGWGGPLGYPMTARFPLES